MKYTLWSVKIKISDHNQLEVEYVIAMQDSDRFWMAMDEVTIDKLIGDLISRQLKSQ